VVVTATEVNTNVKTTATSNEVGNYTIEQLKDGVYTVAAKAPGFKEFIAENVVPTTRDVRRVDVKLEAGSVDTRIEVQAAVTLSETETGGHSGA
jgi:carboxypeptidase family protein